MVRRSFRLGLRLGLLAGVLVAVVKVVQSRRSSREDAWAPAGPGGDAWPPLQAEPVSPEPPAISVPDRLPPVKKSSTLPMGEARPTPTAPSESGPATPPPAPPPPAAAETSPAPPPPPPAPTPPAPAPEASRPVPPPAGNVVPPMAPNDPAAAPTELVPTDAALVEPEPVRTPTRRVRKTGTRRVVRQQSVWMEAVGTECPPSHPVKAKLSSMLYHLPGMVAYKRTRPDRCYADAAAAETDGFTRAKR